MLSELLGSFTVLDFDCVTRTDKVARNIELAAVDLKVTVCDQLASLLPALGKAKTCHHVVKPTLDQCQKGRTRVTWSTGGFIVIITELTLKDTVVSFDFLLLSKTDSILARFAAAKFVHTWNTALTINRTFP